MSNLNVPNILTLGGLACGVGAIFSAIDGDIPIAATALIVAMVLDRLDGVAARLLNQRSALGAQLDSLADLISFGLAPAVLASAVAPGALVRGAGGVYVLCAAWRLARFHEEGLISTRFGAAFVGVPTPGAAVWLLLALAVVPAGLGGAVFPAVLVALAAAMISSAPYLRNGIVLALSIAALGVTMASVWGFIG